MYMSDIRAQNNKCSAACTAQLSLGVPQTADK